MEPLHDHKHKWYTFGCKDATYLTEKSLFTELNLSEKVQLGFHKLMCKYCRRFAVQTQKINAFFKTSSEKSSVTLSDQKKQSLNQLIIDNTRK